MSLCFVIQPFDGGTFDKRFREIFAPAIKAAGLTPYRVDEDPSVAVPIDDIEGKIQESAACLADITLDNPNVWYELGFAMAAGKEVILLCSDERDGRFPFDVQHRTIIKYPAAPESDYETLKADITSRLLARIEKRKVLRRLTAMPPDEEIGGFKPHERALMIAVGSALEKSTDSFSKQQLRRMMESAGYNQLATYLAIEVLVEQELLHESEENGVLVYGLGEYGYEFLQSFGPELGLHTDRPVA